MPRAARRLASAGLLRTTATGVAVALASAACMTSNKNTGGGDGGASSDDGGRDGGHSGTFACGGAAGGGENGGGVISNNWTALTLFNDATNDVLHAAQALVTGIYFAALDKGWIVTKGAQRSSNLGGAVFTARQHAVTGIAFAGPDGGPSKVGAIDFTGLEPTPSGYIAMSYAADIVQSRDGGASFAITRNGAGNPFGIEAVLGYRVTGSGTTLVRRTGVISSSTSAPGPDSLYTDVWAPNASPPIPDPVPGDACRDGPLGGSLPVTRESVFISCDGFIAYTANPGDDPQICLSHDGGHSFKPSHLTVPAGAEFARPTGVLFLSPSVGITWLANAAVTPYLKRTTDGGATWIDVTPVSVVSPRIELHGAFFAPDARHGWIAGFDHDRDAALLLATSDAGASWTAVGSGLAEAVAAAGGSKLYCGFALDETHFWLGGDAGLVLAHE